MLGHSDAALEDLEKASVDSHPNNKAILFGNRAELLCKLRRYDLALEDIKQALKLEPDNIIFHQQLTDLYRRQHKYEEALTQANFTLLLSPNNINTLLLRADIYFIQKKYTDSLTNLNDAIQIDPKNPYALTARGELFFKIRRFGNALKDINESLKIKATNFHALEVCGSILKKQHKYQEALDDFNKSLEIYPLHLINQHPFPNRGEDHIDNSSYDEGFVVTHKMMGERNFSNIYLKRGDTYYKLNEYELALSDYDQSLKLSDGNIPIYKKRAYILHKTKRLDDALMDIDKYLKIYSQCPKALNLRGQIINDIERCTLDDALVDIDKLLKEYPRCPKFLKLREKILNNIKKCNLKKEKLSEFVLSNFGDMEGISIENNVNLIEEVESGPSNGSRQLQY
ncbi:hypothetical protein Glove_290g63 [Diversispora epigaea]|uniref:Uncharacterized protein n=1 Tax=Diversispora epigaea TaxID=1348612 RepID=A0A397I6W7_9GLOM|nr:hypothetical protein Glove_290g63 [Diversispora epigaea]